MAELKTIKKVETTEKVKKERKQKEVQEKVPHAIEKTLKTCWLITLIVLAPIAGLFLGMIDGFLSFLENTLRIFKKEMEK